LLAQCRAGQIEPPSAGRCDRIIRSALHQAEQALTARVTGRLGPDASARLAALAAAADDEEGDGAEPSALALIRSVPGNVSLESMLTEIGKANAVHPAYQAMAEVGRAQRTIFLARYLRDRDLQREIGEGLNVVESWNRANAVTFFGKGVTSPPTAATSRNCRCCACASSRPPWSTSTPSWSRTSSLTRHGRTG
jgi:hypothetical protein